MEESVSFLSEGLKIEGLFENNTNDRGVVITHPHPLYGGDMYNPIVETIAIAYQKKGWSTLRFNFRGVGMSQGGFDNGVGERKDVLSGIAYLRDREKTVIDLAGYSFGTGVIAQVIANEEGDLRDVPRLIMVSPPLGGSDVRTEKIMEKLNLVVTGSRDPIAPADRIEKWLSLWHSKAELVVIEGADHVYGGGLYQLASILDAHI